MIELSLFGPESAPVRASDPSTSRNRIDTRPGKEQVLDAIVKHGALTDEELERYTPSLTPSRRRTARSDLSKGNMKRLEIITKERQDANPDATTEAIWGASRHQLRTEGFVSGSLLWDSGLRRKTKAGGEAIVWELCEVKRL